VKKKNPPNSQVGRVFAFNLQVIECAQRLQFSAVPLPSQPAEQVLQCFPFFSSGFLSPRLLLLGGGFSPFGVTTTVFGGLGGRSSRLCANAPAEIKQHMTTAVSFRFKSNIEFPILLMHINRAWEGE
jgi:hypothetical protein